MKTHRPIIAFAVIGLGVTLAASVSARLQDTDQACGLAVPPVVDVQSLGM